MIRKNIQGLLERRSHTFKYPGKAVQNPTLGTISFPEAWRTNFINAIPPTKYPTTNTIKLRHTWSNKLK